MRTAYAPAAPDRARLPARGEHVPNHGVMIRHLESSLPRLGELAAASQSMVAREGPRRKLAKE